MLAITAVIGSLYVWRGGASLLFLLIASVILMAGGLLLQLFGPRKIQIVRKLSPDRPAAGDTLIIEVQVRFTSRIPLPWMIVADCWPGGYHQELLFPGFRRSFNYSYELREVPRGVHRLQGCSVSWGDLPGLFTGGALVQAEGIFKVFPRPLFISGALPGSRLTNGEIMLKGRGRGSGAEIAEIREYAPGDPLSRIHWKNSARKGTLQSRVPEREQSKMFCVVLANSPENYEIPYTALGPRGRLSSAPPAFEQAVSAAMGLMLSAEHSGAYVQLFSGGWPEGLARHEGVGKIPARVQDMLAEIRPDGTRSLNTLLEDASRSWLPGMTVAVVTGKLEAESARTLARFLVQGVKVELYYVWDQPAPGAGRIVPENQRRQTGLSIGGMDNLWNDPDKAGAGPVNQRTTGMGDEPRDSRERKLGAISESLERLGARIYCLENCIPPFGYKGAEWHEAPGTPTQR